MAKIELIHAGYYYKNDKPNGIGILIHDNPELLKSFYEKAYPKFCDELKSDPEFSDDDSRAKFVEKQLQDIGKATTRPDFMTEGELELKDFVAMSNIQWLTENGYLKNDEFNGVSLHKKIVKPIFPLICPLCKQEDCDRTADPLYACSYN